MRPESLRTKKRQQGFGLVAAMFLIIIIAGVIATMARMAVTQNATTSLAVQQTRAYQAARAGLEWGIVRALQGHCADGNFSLEGLSVRVSCLRATPGTLEEEDRAPVFYQLSAEAEQGQPGQVDHVFRRLGGVVEQ